MDRRIVLLLLLFPSVAAGAPDLRGDFRRLTRTIDQDGGTWWVRYVLVYSRPEMSIPGSSIPIALHGDISNSRVPGHSLPRKVVLDGIALGQLDDRFVLNEFATVSGVKDDCKLRARILINLGHTPDPSGLRLTLGTVIHVDVRLAHDHDPYGAYEPLLGVLTFDLDVGRAHFSDVLRFDRELYTACTPMLDDLFPRSFSPLGGTYYYRSPPDSYYLCAHASGCSRLGSTEIVVRGGAQIRLRFWYLIARGSEGPLIVTAEQCAGLSRSYRLMDDLTIRRELRTTGRWIEEVIAFRAAEETVGLYVTFKLPGTAHIGEVWIDDVELTTGVRPHGP